jgi:hypothetical protein
VPVLDPEPLDRLGRRVARLRELLAHPLAERGGERIDLADGRLSHASMEAGSFARVCDDSSTGARSEAIERLIALFTEPNDAIDVEVLERIDELAWRR